MAYTIAWNESAPVGASTPANEIDNQLRDLKVSIRERLEDLISDWAVDGTDPKTLAAGIFAAGAVGAPGVAPRSISDTGWYWPAADRIALAIGGVKQYEYNSGHLFEDPLSVDGVDVRNASLFDEGNLGAARLPSDAGGLAWDTGGGDLELTDGLGWGGGSVLASSDDVFSSAFAEVTGWWYDALSASSSSTLRMAGGGSTSSAAVDVWIPTVDCIIKSIWACVNGACDAGTLTLAAGVNESPSALSVQINSGAATQQNMASSDVAVSAGDRVQIYWTTSSYSNTSDPNNTVRVGLRIQYT